MYEYVAGGDLATRFAASRHQGKPWSHDTVLGTIRQVVAGLALAHERGLVHRDLKPANVLVADSEVKGKKPQRLKLADFGIGGAERPAGGRRPGDDSSAHRTGADGAIPSEQVSLYRGAGTPLYMSPEQRRGEKPDPRHDLYSLGVMWYQFLVGDVSRELHAGWREELQECQVPEEQIGIIGRCVGLSKNRPKDARELLALLPGSSKATPSGPWAPPSDAATTEFVEKLRDLHRRYMDPAPRGKAEFDQKLQNKQGCLVIGGGFVAITIAAVVGSKLGDAAAWVTIFLLALILAALCVVLSWADRRPRAKLREEEIDAECNAILSGFTQVVKAVGGSAVLRDPDSVVQAILRLQHGVSESFLAGLRKRRPHKTVAQQGHVLELAETAEGSLACFYDGQRKPLSFGVEEQGETALYEIDEKTESVKRNGKDLSDC